MKGSMAIQTMRGALHLPVSAASRGVLAMQGTGLSRTGFGEPGGKAAFVTQAYAPIALQDKPNADWHPIFAPATVGSSTVASADAALDSAERLRNADQATVNRRPRCRPR